MKEGQVITFDASRSQHAEDPPFYLIHGTQGIYLRPYVTDVKPILPSESNERAVVKSEIYGTFIINVRYIRE